MNAKLRETAKREKLGVVKVVIDGRYMNPPRGEIDAELSVSEGMMDRAHAFLVELLKDHKRLSEEE